MFLFFDKCRRFSHNFWHILSYQINSIYDWIILSFWLRQNNLSIYCHDHVSIIGHELIFLSNTNSLFSYLNKSLTSTIHLNFETFDFRACVVTISIRFRCVDASKACNILMNLKLFFEFFLYEFLSTNNAVIRILEAYYFTRSFVKIIRFDFVDSSNKMKIWFSAFFSVEFILWFWRDVIVAFTMHTKTLVWNIID